MRYLQTRHSRSCTFNQGKCPPEVMRQAAVVLQCYGKLARKTHPFTGNAVSQECPEVATEVPDENGLFVLFDRKEVVDGEQDPNYVQFNQRGNGFAAFQCHSLQNAVQVYIWPEDVNNDTGSGATPQSHADLLNNGRSYGLRALFDCVNTLQGQERWWWELSRICSLQDADGVALPKESACTLECRKGMPGWQQPRARRGEKASSPAFEAWFDAVRYQVSLNLIKMGIFGSNAENFLHKVRLCYARRQPYRYNGVYTEVENVPVVYLGDSAGSTDFKKGMSCGRGLLCASQLALDTMDVVLQQAKMTGSANLQQAFRHGAKMYQNFWSSPEMIAEWRTDYDASFKYLQAGRLDMGPMCSMAAAICHNGCMFVPQLGRVMGA